MNHPVDGIRRPYIFVWHFFSFYSGRNIGPWPVAEHAVLLESRVIKEIIFKYYPWCMRYRSNDYMQM